MKRILGLLFFNLVISNGVIPEKGFASEKPKPVQWAEVQSWRDFGPEFPDIALGLDRDGKPLAFYDFSYPDFKKPAKLGSLDSNQAHLGTLGELLTQSQLQLGQVVALDGKKRQALGLRMSLAASMGKAIEKLASDPSKGFLKEGGTILPPRWWKEIPWRSRLLSDSEQPPTAFYLSEVDFERVVKKPKVFFQRMEQIKAGLVPQEAPGSVLDGIEFRMNAGGGYEFYWNPKSLQAADSFSTPYKLADLRCAKCGLTDAMGREVIAELLWIAIGQVPIPVVAGLIAAGVGEFLNFQNELLANHQERLLELIQTGEEGEPHFSPLTSWVNSLDSEQRDALVGYLMYEQTTLFSALRWTYKKPKDVWKKRKKQSIDQALNSTDYLKSHSLQTASINSRFSRVETEAGNWKIFSLSTPRFWNLAPPFVAVDYQNPGQIQKQRIILESGGALVRFLGAFIPIPVVGSLLSIGYDFLLEGPMHTAQHWESRLAVHLNLREAAGENWAFETETLHKQLINPFEVSRAEALQLIALRKNSLGI